MMIFFVIVVAGCSGEEAATNEKEEQDTNTSGYTTKTMTLGEPVIQSSTLGEYEMTIHSVKSIEVPEDLKSEGLAARLVFDVSIQAIDPKYSNSEIIFDDFIDSRLYIAGTEESIGVHGTWAHPEIIDLPEELITKEKPVDGQMLFGVIEEVEDYQLIFGEGLEAATDKLVLEFSHEEIQ
ncbi:hypothetical protein [Aureibacillus halotolerans]|nr:hypothetical protein [Aureibacillus halotolerans]